jgi:cell division protease FtsH
MSTGASDDLNRASRIARDIVKNYGMSSLGPIVFGERDVEVFLGKEYGETRNYSEEMAELIDKEVEKIIRAAEVEADSIIKQNKKLIEKIVEVLMEKETIEKEDFEKIIKGGGK